MAKNDIASRVYDHTFKLDPIIRSLLDTDFYKLLMLQMIWKLYPDVTTTFSVINRTKSVRLAEEIDIEELRAQLDLQVRRLAERRPRSDAICAALSFPRACAVPSGAGRL